MGAAQHHVAMGCPQQPLKLGWPQGLGGLQREHCRVQQGGSALQRMLSPFPCIQHFLPLLISLDAGRKLRGRPSLLPPARRVPLAAVTTGWLVKQQPTIHRPPVGTAPTAMASIST